MQHIIRIYNHQHLESHCVGNTLYLSYLKVITTTAMHHHHHHTFIENLTKRNSAVAYK